MGILARVSGDCAAGNTSLGGASSAVLGLQIRVVMPGSWWTNGGGGYVHALVKYGDGYFALLAGLPPGLRGRCEVSTGWSARPRCPLVIKEHAGLLIEDDNLRGWGTSCRECESERCPGWRGMNVVPGNGTANSLRRRYVHIH